MPKKIDVKQSGYRFRATKELYRQNGNVITKAMYDISGVEIVLAVCIVALLLFLSRTQGLLTPTFVRLAGVALLFYLWISRIVLSLNNCMVSQPFLERDEEICKAIVEMTDEEIELRESRRKRDMLAEGVATVLFFIMLSNSEMAELWTDELIAMISGLIGAFIFSLPFQYYRHRATKRLRWFLLLQGANNQNQGNTVVGQVVPPTSANGFCPNCGNPLENGVNFCPKCGQQRG
jgi:glucan phosphoethanolaminetransferase (alkaline phosphatase superfamily)